MSNVLILEASVLKEHLKDFKGTLKEKLRFAMKEAHEGVVGIGVLTPDEKFRAAVAATIMSSEGEDQERLKWESKGLQAVSAMLNGIPVDMDAFLEEGTSRGWEPIGIVALWREVCGG
jgi:hypothetical protein